jgi:hypothetical protein
MSDASELDSSVRPAFNPTPKNLVHGPTLGKNPVAVTSAETIVPALLSITMSPPSVHVGEQSPLPAKGGVMVPDTSRVMMSARAGLPSASPATMAASAALRNVENIVSPLIVVLSGRRSWGILGGNVRFGKPPAAALPTALIGRPPRPLDPDRRAGVPLTAQQHDPPHRLAGHTLDVGQQLGPARSVVNAESWK